MGPGDRLRQFVRAYLAGRVRWPKTPEQTEVVREWVTTGTNREVPGP